MQRGANETLEQYIARLQHAVRHRDAENKKLRETSARTCLLQVVQRDLDAYLDMADWAGDAFEALEQGRIVVLLPPVKP